MAENTVPQTIEQEIADLQRRLEEKKSAYERQITVGAPDKEMPTEKELVHEVVGEKIQEEAPEYRPSVYQTPTPPLSSAPPVTAETPSYLEPAMKDKVQQLVNSVFLKGDLAGSIKEAAASKNYALLEAFHGILTDQLYDKMVERKILNAVK